MRKDTNPDATAIGNRIASIDGEVHDCALELGRIPEDRIEPIVEIEI